MWKIFHTKWNRIRTDLRMDSIALCLHWIPNSNLFLAPNFECQMTYIDFDISRYFWEFLKYLHWIIRNVFAPCLLLPVAMESAAIQCNNSVIIMQKFKSESMKTDARHLTHFHSAKRETVRKMLARNFNPNIHYPVKLMESQNERHYKMWSGVKIKQLYLDFCRGIGVDLKLHAPGLCVCWAW